MRLELFFMIQMLQVYVKRIDDSFCKENFKTGIKFFKIGHAAGDPRATYALGEHYDYFRKYKKSI
jgi:hypothetical protein